MSINMTKLPCTLYSCAGFELISSEIGDDKGVNSVILFVRIIDCVSVYPCIAVYCKDGQIHVYPARGSKSNGRSCPIRCYDPRGEGDAIFVRFDHSVGFGRNADTYKLSIRIK